MNTTLGTRAGQPDNLRKMPGRHGTNSAKPALSSAQSCGTSSTCTLPFASTMNQLTFVPSQVFCFNACSGPLGFGEYRRASSEAHALLPAAACRIRLYCNKEPGKMDAHGSNQTACCVHQACDFPCRRR